MEVKVRLPNEISYDVLNVEPGSFTVNNIFNDEVFVSWNGLTISIKREDYDRLIKKGD